MKELRIAVYGPALSGWGGGLDFLRLLVQALLIKAQDQNQKQKIKIFLLLPEEYNPAFSIKKNIKNFIKYSILRQKKHSAGVDPVLILESLQKNTNGAFDTVFYKDRELNTTLVRIRADVLLPVGPSSVMPEFCVPHLGFIFDFQHKYFPQFFSPQESLARDQSFETILQRSPVTIVHAQAVKQDIEKFFPAVKSTIYTLPFAASPVGTWFDTYDYQALAGRYNLPEKYFMIANQFWIHKNHSTAFKALAQLIDKEDAPFETPGSSGRAPLKNKNIHIVCTGNTHDYRAPGYFDELRKTIETLGLSTRVHFLGFIPKHDQIMIMKNSLGLIQPTLFEGLPGGGSVWDALGIGVPVLVSDIPVNRELPADRVTFFIPESVDDLACKMSDLLSRKKNETTHNELLDQGRARLEKFGDILVHAISHALNKDETKDG